MINASVPIPNLFLTIPSGCSSIGTVLDLYAIHGTAVEI